MTRAFLLAPCLLLCLSCVTPFPFENLEMGMTMEQVVESFGEPSSTSNAEMREAVALLERETARIFERLESAVDVSETRGPVARDLERLSTRTLRALRWFVAELDDASGEQGVLWTWVYPHQEFSWVAPGNVAQYEVDLLFEGNELISWETRRLPFVPTTYDYGYSNPFPSTNWPNYSQKDIQHHKRGHKHHHGHDC